MEGGPNPTVGGHVEVERFGPELAGPWKTYHDALNVVAVMTAPDTRLKCVALGRARKAEFLVKIPAGVTDVTINYGRWGKGPGGLDGWIHLGKKTLVAADGALQTVGPFDTQTDPAGIWVSAITGAPGASFEFWYRGAPGV